MSALIVSGAGVAGLALAVWLVVAGWETAASPSIPRAEPRRERLIEAVRQLAGTAAAGFVGGFLVAGLGGRFFMRAVGATSGDAAQGRLTEAEEVVGQVTTGGTIFFLFLGAGLGVLGAVGLYALRPWLPARTLVAGLIIGGIGSGLLARPSELLDPDSIDFVILGPVWFSVVFALGIVLLLCTATAVLVDRWSQRWPRPAWTFRGTVAMVPLAMFVLVGFGAVVVLAALAGRAQGTEDGGRSQVGAVASLVLVVAAGVGWLWTATAAVEILTA